MEKKLRQFTILVVACGLYACARQGAPTGGPKDTTPPTVVSPGSTPNYATRFHEKRIELKFDEWITLSEAAAQVMVSPPLVKRPEVTLNGKTVVVKFDKTEQFRENTTYTINFGTAVKDLHEGNPAKDLRFVFSTGDYIDSLRSTGKVVDAFSGEPIDNIAVMLYDMLADSVVRKERPYYFSRTDKSGTFEVLNIKAGRYKAVAVEDLDQNLRWDGENERIGCLDAALLVRDSMRGSLLFRLFKNRPQFRLGEKNTGTFGVVRLKCNTTTDSAVVRPEPVAGLKLLLEKAQDSIQVWYDIDQPTAWKLLVNNDTVPVKPLSKDEFLLKHSLRLASDAPAATLGRKAPQNIPIPVPTITTMTQNPQKPAVFQFNYPVVSTDSTLWMLLVDSVRVLNFSLKTDSTAPRKIALQHAWLPGKTYLLEMRPGAVTDFWGQTNTDTLRRNLAVPTDKQLGGLRLKMEDLRPNQAYVVQLLDGVVPVEERQWVAEDPAFTLVFNRLNLATYTVRLLEDLNNNGRWDTGDYWSHRQPEKTVSKKLEPLRANWEVEATISLHTDALKRKQ
jgi:hypothetical protein